MRALERELSEDLAFLRFFEEDRDFACDFDVFCLERDRDFFALRFGEDELDFASDFDFRFCDLDRDLAPAFDFLFAEGERDSDAFFFFLLSFLSASRPLRGVGERLGLGVLLRELFEDDFLRFRLLLRDFRLDLLRE